MIQRETVDRWGPIVGFLVGVLTLPNLVVNITHQLAARGCTCPPQIRTLTGLPASPEGPDDGPEGPRGGKSSWVSGPSYDGEELTCDLPGDEHIKNRGGRDGQGMCVMSSVEMAARWAGLEQYRGLRDWCARFPGGGYPEKVDRQIRQFSKEKGIAVAPFIQLENGSRDQVRQMLDLIDKNSLMACFTYGYSPRYGRGRIAHMVCGQKYNGKFGVVLDNNFVPKPGEPADQYEWMSREELVNRIVAGSGWIFCWVAPSPPPAPRNAPLDHSA